MTTCEFTVDGPVAIVELHSQDGLNALDDDVIDETRRVISDIAKSSSRALVLRGGGQHFSAGGDFRQLAKIADASTTAEGRAQVAQRTRTNSLIVEEIRALPIATIAAIDGACVGAAIGISAACDLRVATPRSVFSTAYMQLGLVSDFGAATLLAETIGTSRAAAWLLQPHRRTAEEALGAGFIAEVVEPEKLHDHALEIAAQLARFPDAVAALKRTLHSPGQPLSERLDAEANDFAATVGLPEAAAAVRSAWSGR